MEHGIYFRNRGNVLFYFRPFLKNHVTIMRFLKITRNYAKIRWSPNSGLSAV